MSRAPQCDTAITVNATLEIMTILLVLVDEVD